LAETRTISESTEFSLRSKGIFFIF